MVQKFSFILAFCLSLFVLQLNAADREHKCCKACHENGKCSKAHGEKGHDCDQACKSKKEHTCSKTCKEGEHTYSCGEKEHTCSKSCHK